MTEHDPLGFMVFGYRFDSAIVTIVASILGFLAYYV